MSSSVARLTEAQRLSEAGRYQALLDYLEPQPKVVLKNSPTLALLCGSANARLGRDAEATRWVDVALERAKEQGDRAVEARALNLRGAIALEAGRVQEAANHFMHALDAAKRQNDHATMGRCSNNLGIIADQQGEYGRAVSWYRLALAAYQQAGLDRGITETHHNLAMTYLAEGNYKQALAEADHAVREAHKMGDLALWALALSGRAEIRVLDGDEAFARREVEQALAQHRAIGDVVGEAQDLRILAMALAAGGETEDADKMLRDVLGEAEKLGRPHLAATAGRELALLLQRLSRLEEAREIARAARERFEQLGAEAEARKLKDLAEG
jgi:tetratricopeptide (TPR) repeat protein